MIHTAEQKKDLPVRTSPSVISDFRGLSGKIGIFGGTFDPIHLAHLDDALVAKEKLGLDYVVFLPTKHNPLKVEGPILTGEQRVSAIERAISPHPGLYVCPMLVREEGTRDYATDFLLRAKCQADPDAQLFFLAGADVAENLHQWKNIHQALKTATFSLIARPGASLDVLDRHFSREEVTALKSNAISGGNLDISSTAIRRDIAEGRIEEVPVPESVRTYLKEQGVYRDSRVVSTPSLDQLRPAIQIDGALRSGARAARVDESASAIADQLSLNHEPLKVAVAQINSWPGNLDYNYRKISEGIIRADREGADVVVFPELSTVGYFSMDHLLDSSYIAANRRVLNKVCSDTVGKDVVAIVGFVDEGPDRGDGTRETYNAAAIIKNGEILQIVHKISLPSGDLFVEPRYFTPGRDIRPVPVTLRNGRKVVLGVHICEDLWDVVHPRKVCQELLEQGAEVYVNLSGSPHHIGKGAYRHNLISGKALQLEKPFVYCNVVGLQDGYDGEVSMDGRSMVFDHRGRLIGLGKSFEEDFFIVDLYRSTPIALPTWLPEEEMYDSGVMGIRRFTERFDIKNLHLGISGGIDSGIVAGLAVQAVGAHRVIGHTLPGPVHRDWRTRLGLRPESETLHDAHILAGNMGFKLYEHSISPLYRVWEREALREKVGTLESLNFRARRFLAELGIGSRPTDPLSRRSRQNAQSRLRGFHLMQKSNDDPNSIVLDTGNRTEGNQKYWTYMGDGIGALGPIADADKAPEAFALAREINRRFGFEAIPNRMIERPPSAELEEGQTDEADLPAPYSVLGPLAAQLTERKVSVEELLQRYPLEVVDAAIRRQNGGEAFRRQRPPAIRYHDNTFGLGRRIPNSTRWPDVKSEFFR